MSQATERPARKVPVVTEDESWKQEPNPLMGTESMWAVQATRVFNPDTRYETTVTVPTFYLDPRAQGITNRAHARITAAAILGVDVPGTKIIFDVHLV